MLSENQKFDSVPFENLDEIKMIVQNLQELELFNRIDEFAQVRIAKAVHKDPICYAMYVLQVVKNGLCKKDPLLNETEDLLNLAFKVAYEYGNNHWLVSKISHCINALNNKDTNEVRSKVLEVLGEE